MKKCGICGEPMPAGEEVFNYHGYSGPCPKPPLNSAADEAVVSSGRFKELWRLHGGAADRKGHAWIEMDLLPGILQRIVDAVWDLKTKDQQEKLKRLKENQRTITEGINENSN